jgi:hypothetical protein
VLQFAAGLNGSFVTSNRDTEWQEANGGEVDYNDRGPSWASIIRLASATICSEWLFSKLEGLSANERVDPGAKITALQPFPTELTSIRYPLYSTTVIRCATHQTDPADLLVLPSRRAQYHVAHWRRWLNALGVSAWSDRQELDHAKMCGLDAHFAEGTFVLR